MNEIKLSLNASVKVKLTQKGIEHYVNKRNSYYKDSCHHITYDSFRNRADKGGYHTFQLWSLIDYFGGLHMELQHYLSIDVVVNEKDLIKL